MIAADLRPASPIPLYYQLAERISAAVCCATFPLGTVLESEPAMARRLGISRNTVRRAMGILHEQRIIARRKGGPHAVVATTAGHAGVGYCAPASLVPSIKPEGKQLE
ncbi:hypothetical protein TUM20985_20120 [Mycobacterium antarcticum]|nr:hypothetical protein TUM20985_20120 [Mycolicibacterium sp. TUM20985]GLP74812.1 hypothetical protein TUM20983_19220 [Mycolicibacterium sp. TUM20983]GLP80612.1 hypothetical protein TUM20984_20320 [Mycolicibacterium sp. TUM20984]